MTEFVVKIFLISLNIISIVILAYLLFSRHKMRITFIGFWKNILLLTLILLASQIAKFYGFNYFSELIFLAFSFMVMLTMVVTFVLHYPTTSKLETFEMKKKES